MPRGSFSWRAGGAAPGARRRFGPRTDESVERQTQSSPPQWSGSLFHTGMRAMRGSHAPQCDTQGRPGGDFKKSPNFFHPREGMRGRGSQNINPLGASSNSPSAGRPDGKCNGKPAACTQGAGPHSPPKKAPTGN
ncbi:unnamed protein product [Lepidochelys kempii]